ncbi:MAG: cysteine desulfurase [Fimbriimonadaceae bacterium]|nr:cysteine desulfurase [Fimbriimonadaceae bacterium]
MNPENYFDNAATTPVDARVLREMLPYFETDWGNANSLHASGRQAMAAVDHARDRVAALLGVAESPQTIIFTSGATESNNWIFTVQPQAAISPFEHDSAREAALAAHADVLENDGLTIKKPQKNYNLISVMSVNNEIGSRWKAAEFRQSAEYIHSDVTQAVGKITVDLEGVDFASLSAHKFYGPKGVGALFAADGAVAPIFWGGLQDRDSRSGTLNVPGIVGMGAAAAIAQDEMQDNLAHVQEMRAIVLEALRPCSDYQINGGDNVSPYILSVSFKGLEGETLVIEMDQRGYAISSGAACSSRSTEPSHVLTALKMPLEWLRGTLRISFGKFNSKESAANLGRILTETVERLRNLRTI